MTQNKESSSHKDLSDFFKMPVGILWVGQDGTILNATQNELEILGYSPRELEEQNLSDILGNKEETEDLLQKHKAGVEVNDYHTQLLCSDGTNRRVLINSDVKRENGEYIHSRFFIRDITEQQNREITNALLASIIDNSNDAIVSKDLNGIITSWNASAERIFGYTAKEAIGQLITIIIPDERLGEESEILTKIRNGERVDHFETIREHKNGTKLNISLNISPIKDSEGTIVGASKIARDISERKQAEADLEKYQKQLRSLVAELSRAKEQERQHLATELHDNLGQLLSMSKIKLDQLDKDLSAENISSNLHDLKELIDEANSYTRDLMSQLKPPPALDYEHFGTGLKWIAQKMEQFDLSVSIKDDQQSKPISLNDEMQTVLLQSIRELLFNVAKHAGVDNAEIAVSRIDNKLQVTVKDEGKGFYPEEHSTASEAKSGFGLFNIQEQIDLLGGSVEINSEPGKGTRVTLTAPTQEEEQSDTEVADTDQPDRISSPLPAKKQNGKIKVLLADDHRMMRKGIRKLIETEDDFLVIGEASNGKEAVELALESSPDVIIMDINMPQMNGIEATKKILSDRQTTVIGLSVHDSEDVIRSMEKAGASAHLSKSEVFETLCSTIRHEAKII